MIKPHNKFFFFFSSRRRHTRSLCDWSSDVCSSDLWYGDKPCDPDQTSPRRPINLHFDWDSERLYSRFRTGPIDVTEGPILNIVVLFTRSGRNSRPTCWSKHDFLGHWVWGEPRF